MSKSAEDKHGEAVATDSTTATDSVAAYTRNQRKTDAYIGRSSVLDPVGEYKMDNKRRGLALILNQDLEERGGTSVDHDNLERSLRKLNFEVKSYNVSKQVEVLDEAAKANHSDADCFLLVFLSHGENDAKDGEIDIQDLTSRFKGDKCKSLVGKPKIFIIQTCRGETFDIPVTSCDVTDSKMEVDSRVVHTLPAGADFVICYSVAEGYRSHQDAENGSWYIQDLCEMLQEFGDSLEFTELLTVVNRKVSLRSLNSEDLEDKGEKQAPCFSSMLTKKLYFTPKK